MVTDREIHEMLSLGWSVEQHADGKWHCMDAGGYFVSESFETREEAYQFCVEDHLFDVARNAFIDS